jgi:hypothetical protein
VIAKQGIRFLRFAIALSKAGKAGENEPTGRRRKKKEED